MNSSCLKSVELDKDLPLLEILPEDAIGEIANALGRFQNDRTFENYKDICHRSRQCWGTFYAWWLDRGRCDAKLVNELYLALTQAIADGENVSGIMPGSLEQKRIESYRNSMSLRLQQLTKLETENLVTESARVELRTSARGKDVFSIPDIDRRSCAKAILLNAAIAGLNREIVEVKRELLREAGPAIESSSEQARLVVHAFARAALLLEDSEKIACLCPTDIVKTELGRVATQLRDIILLIQDIRAVIETIGTWADDREGEAQQTIHNLGESNCTEVRQRTERLYVFVRDALPLKFQLLNLEHSPIAVVRWAALLLANAGPVEPFFPTSNLVSLVRKCQLKAKEEDLQAFQEITDVFDINEQPLDECISTEVERIIDAIASQHGFAGVATAPLAFGRRSLTPDFCDEINYGLELDRSQSGLVLKRTYDELHTFFTITGGQRPWGHIAAAEDGRLRLDIVLDSKRFQSRSLDQLRWVSTRDTLGE